MLNSVHFIKQNNFLIISTLLKIAKKNEWLRKSYLEIYVQRLWKINFKSIYQFLTWIRRLNSNIFFLVDTVKRNWKNLFDTYRKARERKRDQVKSEATGSKIPTCKFYNEMNFLKDIVTNRVTTTNLAIPESDINVTTPPGSQTFTLQQQMSPSCHPVVSQSVKSSFNWPPIITNLKL